MSTVTSADGTTIHFDVRGVGQPLIVVDGATAHPAVNPLNAELAELLQSEFRTYTYDRRGRGQSTDTAPYAVQREIEDIAALIEHAGAPAIVLGYSSGSLLALDTATADLPVSAVVMFEPPVVVDDSRPPLPTDYVEQLEAHIAAGNPDLAAELFMTAAVGLPPEMVAGIRQSPMWQPVVDVAHTISYDGRIMGTTMSGNPLPTDRWSTVTAPVLVMYGQDTWPTLISGAQAVATHLPTATLLPVPGENHSTTPDALATALRTFTKTL
ncbi:alpha/beta hydrolase [Kribbella sandramycini]|uniref:Alpha/beta hydrolase n=1 Tax=Kribbella sandramycini TaxID=60450 RepID=A0A7Y4NZI0_9ACTN|nr:alpha/beta hydrolase [Kribbella sandramycini]MBB6565798.1 pimeloyl-ACP methyl ester carboxylesterase [Kribbella sandramycini]NOL42062.1 alpha/beta hydrolase [Kribbella sandramycini]